MSEKIAMTPLGQKIVAVYIIIAGVLFQAAAITTLNKLLDDTLIYVLLVLGLGNAVALGLAAVSLFEHAECAKHEKVAESQG